MGEVQVLTVDVCFPCCQHLSSRLKPARHLYDLCIFDKACQDGVWRTSLRDSDPHACAVDLLSGGRCCASPRDIAVVYFHKCHAKHEVFSTRWIACSNSDVPVIAREAFVVTHGVVVGLEFNRYSETRSEGAGNGDGNTADGTV